MDNLKDKNQWYKKTTFKGTRSQDNCCGYFVMLLGRSADYVHWTMEFRDPKLQHLGDVLCRVYFYAILQKAQALGVMDFGPVLRSSWIFSSEPWPTTMHSNCRTEPIWEVSIQFC